MLALAAQQRTRIAGTRMGMPGGLTLPTYQGLLGYVASLAAVDVITAQSAGKTLRIRVAAIAVGMSRNLLLTARQQVAVARGRMGMLRHTANRPARESRHGHGRKHAQQNGRHKYHRDTDITRDMSEPPPVRPGRTLRDEIMSPIQ